MTMDGCDYCGEQKPVLRSKAGMRRNWKAIYLCEICRDIYRNSQYRMSISDKIEKEI